MTAVVDWEPASLEISRLRDRSEVELVTRVHARVAAQIGDQIGDASSGAIRLLLAEHVPAALEQERVVLSRADRIRLQEAVFAETAGYGPIHDLLLDDSVSEVMVNGDRDVWVERDGRLYLTDVRFADSAHVLRIIQRVVAPLGRRIDESSPMVDARLPDGSRVNAIIPPLSLIGPVLTIRKFRAVALTPDALVAAGSITPEALRFLRTCVLGRLNVVVAGGSGAGKTTLLNALSSFISAGERIVTIEDAAELRLQQRHVIPLESRPANAEGVGRVTIRELLRNALRMRPDRLVIGECRGAEALDMLQAMNTGHDGSLTTIHSNSAADAVARIETMALMAEAALPLRALRDQVASAIDLVVFVERAREGKRRVTEISELGKVSGDEIEMHPLFAMDVDRGGLRRGDRRPAFETKLRARGLELEP
ncbi:MAG TPA: CpaF family protein [Candidatus Limnocylindria bacterium]|nr:CpaF family protein [Candidatus Limnocylindria bacterium]